jgi:hypothetical protein
MVCYVISFGPIQSPILGMKLKLGMVLRPVRTSSTMEHAVARSFIREPSPPFFLPFIYWEQKDSE